MRYLSSLPLRARSSSPASRPTDPLAIQQRAQPSTCVLSLASVTVSMQAATTTTASAGASSTMDMDVDSDPFAVAVPLADVSNGTGGIPFPSSKRTHSLLRSTPSVPREALEDEENAVTTTEEEPSSPPDPDFNPPRKRTRTSALSSPTSSKSRSQRASRVSVASVHLSGCSVAPTPSRSPPSPPSCISLMSMKSSSSTAPPSTAWSRRRMMPGEMRVLLYLYRTLVYGLEVRRQSLLAACGVEQREETLTANATAVPSNEDSLSEKSSLEIQEALLAQHLKSHLLANGVAAYMLTVNPDSVAQEGRPKTPDAPSELEIDSIDMLVDVDGDGESINTPDASAPFQHPHIHPSTTHTVLSYQQLVATLYIRQTLYPRRPSTKLSAKRGRPRRPGSKLSQSVSLD